MNADEVEIEVKSAAIDLRLCELLGDKPGEFIVVHVNGEPLKGAGTPPDSPEVRKRYLEDLRGLNVPGSKDWRKFWQLNWPDLIRQFKLPQGTTAETWQPRFTIKVQRVCAGYSEWFHAAMGLFETLKAKLECWELIKDDDGKYHVALWNHAGDPFHGRGDEAAPMIAEVFVRFLEAENKQEGGGK